MLLQLFCTLSPDRSRTLQHRQCLRKLGHSAGFNFPWMRPRAVKFILFHLKRALANRATSDICPGPVPCVGFSRKSYAGSVEPGILSPYITLQQFKTLAAVWIWTAHVPQLGPSRMSAVTFVMSILVVFVEFNRIEKSFL